MEEGSGLANCRLLDEIHVESPRDEVRTHIAGLIERSEVKLAPPVHLDERGADPGVGQVEPSEARRIRWSPAAPTNAGTPRARAASSTCSAVRVTGAVAMRPERSTWIPGGRPW